MIEILGTIASLFVFVSFIFNDEKTMRLINIIGCVLFVIYGIIIISWSVILVNGGLIILHIYKLIKRRFNNGR